MTIPSLFVRPGRQYSVLSRHPWVHERSLVLQQPEPELGTVVDLVQQDGRWLARGLYNPDGRLKVRLYTWNPAEPLSDEFFLRRLDAAIDRRGPLGLSGDQQALRLVFSEADGLSGLIIDRYGPYVVIQVTAAVMWKRLDSLVAHLQARLEPAGIIARVESQTAKAEQLEPGDRVVAGTAPSGPVAIEEHGLRYQLDLSASQKTGLYLDQRENRLAAARYLKGRRVLDVCSYVGGFALVAAKHGAAESVVGVDTSNWAVSQATANAQQNGITNVRFEQGDMFETLQQRRQQGEKYDAVILDPPKFAGSRADVKTALRAYERLNRGALQLLPPGESW